jgi:2-keto-3-deoxy-L-rhamnonate aldolase RhmA
MPLTFENKMIVQLKKLRDEYGLGGIKAEFEAEGSGFNDLVRLRRVTAKLNIQLNVKIGGVEAIRDLHDCAELGVDGIIAPMVESPFGAKKFVESIKALGIQNLFHISINVETASAVAVLDEIISQIKGIVHNITIGRTDLSGSYFDPAVKPNSPFISGVVKDVSARAHEAGITATMGGSINSETIRLFNEDPEIAKYLIRMETRKVIMPTNVMLNNKNALKEALLFEELYILSKKEFFDLRINSEMGRLTNLKTRV